MFNHVDNQAQSDKAELCVSSRISVKISKIISFIGVSRMYRKRKHRIQGSAMNLSMLVVVLLSITGIGMMSLGLNSQLTAISECQKIEARCAADSGLKMALFQMRTQLNTLSDDYLPNLTNTQMQDCDATFSYNITANTLNSKKKYIITCIGRSAGATHTVSTTVGLKGLFDSAILVKDRISLMPNSIVNGYNSDDPLDTNLSVKIGTVSIESDRIPIGPGTLIEADVFVGVGGDPATGIGSGGTITGDKYSLIEEIDFPVITPPSLPITGNALDGTGATITMTPAQSGQYTNLNLQQGGGNPGVLEITGGEVKLHITGDIDAGNGCELIIRPGSSLIIYIDGNIATANSFGFNNETGNVKDFKLYATGQGQQVFDIKAKNDVFGVIYAPEADINIYPNTQICGAIVGKNVIFKSGCTFSYDAALRNVDLGDEGVRLIQERWSEQ
jgi:hypothetical protein